jgi:hypothetical protein
VLHRDKPKALATVLPVIARRLDAAGPKATFLGESYLFLTAIPLLAADDLPFQLPLDVPINKPRA